MNVSKDHYRRFEELYGQLPSEVDRPSHLSTPAISEAKAVDKEIKKLLVAANKPMCVCSRSSVSGRKTMPEEGD